MNQFEKELVKIQQNEAIKEYIDSFETTLNFIGLAVKTQKAYFDELVKEGFTEEQALEIIKAHGMDIGRSSKTGKSGSEQ